MSLTKVWAIVRKDLALEKRSREMLSSMFIFGLIVILLFSFSFELRVERADQVAPGMLWVAFTFAGMLGLARSFVLERDQGCLDGLLLCPIDRSILYVGTDVGVYVTKDAGKTWTVLGGNLPSCFVHDLIIHPRDNVIVIATHGRGMWAMDAESVNKKSQGGGRPRF